MHMHAHARTHMHARAQRERGGGGNVCHEEQEELKTDPQFLTEIVTGDDSWCYGYELESKQQSRQWKSPNSPRLKKAQQVCSSVKRMLISFFEVDGIVHREFVPPRKQQISSFT